MRPAQQLNMGSDVRLPHWLVQARQQLDQNFHERLTTAYIARPVGVPPVYLAQRFRQFFGCGVIEYLARRRLAYACRELRNTNHALATIATAAGFYDQGHFTRTFKRFIGITPSEYRRRKRGR